MGGVFPAVDTRLGPLGPHIWLSEPSLDVLNPLDYVKDFANIILPELLQRLTVLDALCIQIPKPFSPHMLLLFLHRVLSQ